MLGVNHFKELFKATPIVLPELASQGISSILSDEDDLELLRPFTGEDVHYALFSMQSTKSPGPDDISALFYQRYWHIIGPDVTKFVIEILDGAPLPEDLNYTFIALIPKVTSSFKMKDLRHVSLCSVLYKIILSCLLTG